MRGSPVPAAAVIVFAIVVRLLVFVEIKDGPVPHMRVWTQSDMSFFDGWARAIVAGDLLTDQGMRPYHGRHRELACAALALGHDPRPCDEATIRSTWDGWVGEGTFWQDPLYPYGLALLYAVLGSGVFVGYALNVVLGVATVALVYRIALDLGGTVAAVAAGLLAALYGPLVFYETLLLREVAIACVGLTLIALVLRSIDAAGRPNDRLVVVCGFVAGLFVMLKASGLPFVLLVPVFLASGVHASGRPAWRTVAAFCAGLLAALAPLVARNVVVGTAPFGLASTGPLNFLNGNAVGRAAGGGSTISELAAPILVQTGGEAWDVIRATIASHASLWSWTALLRDKLAVFWQLREIPNNASYDYFGLQAPLFARISVDFVVVAALAVPGIAPAMRRPRACALLLAYIAAGIAVCVVFYNLSRFRLPVACAMMPLAGCTIAAGLTALRERHWARFGVGAALALAVAASIIRTGDVPVVPDSIRIADYGVANEITVYLARRGLASGDAAAADALLGRQLRTEPAALRSIEPEGGPTTVSRHEAAVAGTFVEMHRAAAETAVAAGRSAEAAAHRRRAWILEQINAPYALSTSR